MIMLRRAVVVAAAAMMAVTAGTALPAQAQTKVFHDQVGDVRDGINVKSLRVHNGARLIMKSKHTDLSRNKSQSIAYYIDVNGSRPGPEYLASAGFPDSDWQILRMKGWKVVGSGPINCNSDFLARYVRNVTQFALSRGCLGGDRGRVRVSMVAGRTRADGTVLRDYLPARHRFTGWVLFK